MIIFINGSINSGKSTVSSILAKKMQRAAIMEIDSFHAMIEWMPIEQAIPLNLENAVSVIKNFLKYGIDVIVPYPLSEKNYQYFLTNLAEFKSDIRVFTLNPKLEVVLTNRGTRSLTEWEVARIKHHYNIGIHSPSFGEIIDNTNESAENTASRIMQLLRSS